jgi:transposase
MREDAPQREHRLRDLFNAIRYVVKTGCTWRFLPHDFPPWSAVYQQARRWTTAGVFETVVHDLRMLLRVFSERHPDPTAVIFDARTLQSTPESGGRAGYHGHKKKNGSKVHIAVDTLGNLLAIHVTAANEQERAIAGELAAKVQEVSDGRATSLGRRTHLRMARTISTLGPRLRTIARNHRHLALGRFPRHPHAAVRLSKYITGSSQV